MSLCNHEGMHRERTRPAPAPHACLCTFCDLALFRSWLERARALPKAGKKYGEARRKLADAIRIEVWDSMIQRDAQGIGITLGEVVHALYIGDDDDAAVVLLEDLVSDEEMLQASLDPADRFRGCPSKPLAPTPLFGSEPAS